MALHRYEIQAAENEKDTSKPNLDGTINKPEKKNYSNKKRKMFYEIYSKQN